MHKKDYGAVDTVALSSTSTWLYKIVKNHIAIGRKPKPSISTYRNGSMCFVRHFSHCRFLPRVRTYRPASIPINTARKDDTGSLLKITFFSLAQDKHVSLNTINYTHNISFIVSKFKNHTRRKDEKFASLATAFGKNVLFVPEGLALVQCLASTPTNMIDGYSINSAGNWATIQATCLSVEKFTSLRKVT